MTAYTIGIRVSSTPELDAFNRTNEKLNAPRLKMAETMRRTAKGLFSPTILAIFEKILVSENLFLISVMDISLTKKIKIVTAIAPGIREKRKYITNIHYF